MAQGTVRPLSERLFFLGFWHLFGMEALPYRIFVFATQFCESGADHDHYAPANRFVCGWVSCARPMAG